MHPVVLQFLKDWVEGGAVEPHFYFNKSLGLCSCLRRYVRRGNYSNDEGCQLENEFEYILKKDLGDYNFPFNESYIHFDREENKTMNTYRVDWVKEKIANA